MGKLKLCSGCRYLPPRPHGAGENDTRNHTFPCSDGCFDDVLSEMRQEFETYKDREKKHWAPKDEQLCSGCEYDSKCSGGCGFDSDGYSEEGYQWTPALPARDAPKVKDEKKTCESCKHLIINKTNTVCPILCSERNNWTPVEEPPPELPKGDGTTCWWCEANGEKWAHLSDAELIEQYTLHVACKITILTDFYLGHKREDTRRARLAYTRPHPDDPFKLATKMCESCQYHEDGCPTEPPICWCFNVYWKWTPQVPKAEPPKPKPVLCLTEDVICPDCQGYKDSGLERCWPCHEIFMKKHYSKKETEKAPKPKHKYADHPDFDTCSKCQHINDDDTCKHANEDECGSDTESLWAPKVHPYAGHPDLNNCDKCKYTPMGDCVDKIGGCSPDSNPTLSKWAPKDPDEVQEAKEATALLDGIGFQPKDAYYDTVTIEEVTRVFPECKTTSEIENMVNFINMEIKGGIISPLYKEIKEYREQTKTMGAEVDAITGTDHNCENCGSKRIWGYSEEPCTSCHGSTTKYSGWNEAITAEPEAPVNVSQQDHCPHCMKETLLIGYKGDLFDDCTLGYKCLPCDLYYSRRYVDNKLFTTHLNDELFVVKVSPKQERRTGEPGDLGPECLNCGAPTYLEMSKTDLTKGTTYYYKCMNCRTQKRDPPMTQYEDTDGFRPARYDPQPTTPETETKCRSCKYDIIGCPKGTPFCGPENDHYKFKPNTRTESKVFSRGIAEDMVKPYPTRTKSALERLADGVRSLDATLKNGSPAAEKKAKDIILYLMGELGGEFTILYRYGDDIQSKHNTKWNDWVGTYDITPDKYYVLTADAIMCYNTKRAFRRRKKGYKVKFSVKLATQVIEILEDKLKDKQNALRKKVERIEVITSKHSTLPPETAHLYTCKGCFVTFEDKRGVKFCKFCGGAVR